ncbi:2-C-methyl-D-erythritol 2,4-cyclodiphosphate synthase, partial [Acinetobacter baumannii]
EMCIRDSPKLAKYNLEMRQSIADVLNVDLNQISIKATTTEKLGFTGRQEGILATATVLISH